MYFKEWVEMSKKGTSTYLLLLGYTTILAVLTRVFPNLKIRWIIFGVLFTFSILIFFYFYKKKLYINKKPEIIIDIIHADILKPKKNYISILPFNVFFEDSLDEKFIHPHSINGKVIREYPDIIGDHIELDCIRIDEYRKNEGSKRFKEYEIGSHIRRNNFLIIAFAKNNTKFQPILSIPEYFQFLEDVCRCIDSATEDKFMIPIFGTNVLNTINFILDLETTTKTLINFIKTYKFTKSKTIEICYYSDEKTLMKFKHDILR